MKNLSLIIFILFSYNLSIQAQVSFNIDLLADNKTYLVSFISDEEIVEPKNNTSNIQVVLKVPYDESLQFKASDIESYIPSVSWINDVEYDIKTAIHPYQLLSFSMTQASTKNIEYKAGVVTPLFSFRNKYVDCVGEIVLPDNKDEVVLEAIRNGLNFTQSITTLNKRGNSFEGIENGTVNCNSATGLNDQENDLSLRAFPVPTEDYLFVEWENPNGYDKLRIEIINMHGQVLSQREVIANKGLYNEKIEVRHFAEGLYAFRLINDRGEMKYQKFLVAK